jgi:hypothetical protein
LLLRREVSSLDASRTEGWTIVFCDETVCLGFVDHGVVSGAALAAVSPVGSGCVAVSGRLSSRISSDVLFLLVMAYHIRELFNPMPEVQDIFSRGAVRIVFGHA